MIYLITGGAGFIGSYYLHTFVKRNPNDMFVCVDKLTYASNVSFLDALNKESNFIFHRIDICDKKGIFELFEKYEFDIVINFAAETHVDNSIVESDVFFKTNVFGTKVLLDACLNYGIKRFHQVSTDEVYGNNSTNHKFTEKSILNPSSPYSASKAAADLLVLSYYKTYGIPVTISRSCNNFGPNQHIEKLIPNVVKHVVNNSKIWIYGNGTNVREWIYVEDHCLAINAIINFGVPGEIYNVGSGTELSNNEIVYQVLDIINSSRELIDYIEDRKGHDFRYGIDVSKINRLCGWKPIFNFYDSLVLTINFLRSKNILK